MNDVLCQVESVIRVDRATFTFPGRSVPALLDISLDIQPGTITLLAGRTGSGKSTLLKLLADWIPRHSAGTLTGSVRFADHVGEDELPAGYVGYLLQSPDEQICTTSVAAEVAFGLENMCLPTAEIARRIDESLALCGLAEVRDRHPRELSGGQLQRLMLAAVLAMGPRVIVLDEPCSQLDGVAVQELIELLVECRRQGIALVIAEHRLDELLEHADRLLVIDQGRLVEQPGEAALRTIGWLPVEASDISKALPRGEASLLEIHDLVVSYGKRAEPVLNGVSLTLHRGEIVALVGRNGCGKSTLLQTLATGGSWQSGNIIEHAPSTLVRGFLPQNPDLALFNPTVRAELAYAGNGNVDALAQAFNLSDKLWLPPFALSQGERLRTALAATCALDPHLLLLDEPSTGQDPRQVESLLTLVEQALTGNQTERSPRAEAILTRLQAVLFTSHDWRIVARFATRVIVLAAGKVQADLGIEAFMNDEQARKLAGWPRRVRTAAPRGER